MDHPIEKLDAFEARIGHRFANRDLLTESLTHPSLNARQTSESRDYQRLEFLGDAVIQYVITRALFTGFPEKNEGALTRSRSALTRGAFLAGLAREIGLPDLLRMSEAEHALDGHRRSSALEDGLEALVGAIHEDAGLETAASAVLTWYGPLAERLAPLQDHHNPKGRLQEKVQPQFGNHALAYQVIREEGDAHRREFAVEVHLNGERIGSGTGSSKKKAEERAARAALETLRARELP
jgi:ribonuclease-3